MGEVMSLSVLQVGDSLSNGDSVVVGHVPSVPWGGWLALANGWSFTRHSITGKTSGEIVGEILPLAEHGYTVGCFTAGANDIAARHWDEESTAANLEALWRGMSERCDHVISLRLPDNYFHIPGVPAEARLRTGVVNEVMGSLAKTHGGSLVDIGDFRGPRYIRPDQVHFTSIGDLVIASRAAKILSAEGLPTKAPESLRLGNPEVRIGPAVGPAYAAGLAKQATRQSAKRLLRSFNHPPRAAH